MYTPTQSEVEALALIRTEKDAWKDAQVWFTDKESFLMRNVVKKARRNFYGIFSEQKDPITGRDKIFVPMTEWIVETFVKNLDIDTSNIRVEPKKRESSTSAMMADKLLINRFDKMRFGQVLNDMLRNLCIDGQTVLKVIKENGKVVIKNIDVLNMYWEPSVCIDESSGVIEQNTLSIPEIQKYKGKWKNVEHVKGHQNVDRSNLFASTANQTTTEIPYVSVYERYGWADKFILTGNEADRGEYVYLQIIASDIDNDGVVHVIRQVKEHPYQDFQFKKLINRGWGRGPAEMLFNIQAYVNEVVNSRVNTARVVQTGYWRAGTSIRPQDIKNLFQTSVIRAEQGQIERINPGTIDPSSYKDEDTAYQWAQRVTQTQREDEVAANKPATNALMEEKGATKAYEQILENIYLSLSKFIEDKVFPMIISTLEKEELLKITGDIQDLRDVVKPFARNMVRAENAKEMKRTGYPVLLSQEQEDQEVELLVEEVINNEKSVWLPIMKQAFDFEYEINIDPSSEGINKALMINNLNTVFANLTQAGVPISESKDTLQEIYDLMGLPGERLVASLGKMQQQQEAQMPMQDMSGATMPSQIQPSMM